MNDKSPIDMEPEVNSNAVSIYGQGDAMDDFPVLKAFQQYIDAEQAKARKRLISLGIFFGIMMGAVIAVFLVLLFNINERNQTLNDRLVEFAMKERQQQAAVVVQPPVQQDNTALLSLTSKLEELQKKLNESEKKAEASEKKAEAAERAQKEAAAAAASALAPKPPSPQELEIIRLKAQLEAQKEAAAAEKAKQREAELEAYRRKHYPECYAPKKPIRPAPVTVDEEDDDDLEEKLPVRRVKRRKISPESVLNGKAIRYFDDEEDDEPKEKAEPKTEPIAVKAEPPSQPAEKAKPEKAEPSKVETPKTAEPVRQPEPKPYVIPVEVKGKQSSWRLP